MSFVAGGKSTEIIWKTLEGRIGEKISCWASLAEQIVCKMEKLFAQRIKTEIHAVFGDAGNNFGDFRQLRSICISNKRKKVFARVHERISLIFLLRCCENPYQYSASCATFHMLLFFHARNFLAVLECALSGEPENSEIHSHCRRALYCRVCKVAWRVKAKQTFSDVFSLHGIAEIIELFSFLAPNILGIHFCWRRNFSLSSFCQNTTSVLFQSFEQRFPLNCWYLFWLLLTLLREGNDVEKEIKRDLATEHETRRMMTKPYCDSNEEELQDIPKKTDSSYVQLTI